MRAAAAPRGLSAAGAGDGAEASTDAAGSAGRVSVVCAAHRAETRLASQTRGPGQGRGRSCRPRTQQAARPRASLQACVCVHRARPRPRPQHRAGHGQGGARSRCEGRPPPPLQLRHRPLPSPAPRASDATFPGDVALQVRCARPGPASVISVFTEDKPRMDVLGGGAA